MFPKVNNKASKVPCISPQWDHLGASLNANRIEYDWTNNSKTISPKAESLVGRRSMQIRGRIPARLVMVVCSANSTRTVDIQHRDCRISK